jgi:hypothetical protein
MTIKDNFFAGMSKLANEDDKSWSLTPAAGLALPIIPKVLAQKGYLNNMGIGKTTDEEIPTTIVNKSNKRPIDSYFTIDRKAELDKPRGTFTRTPKVVVSPDTNIGVIGHELGHAKNYARITNNGKNWQRGEKYMRLLKGANIRGAQAGTLNIGRMALGGESNDAVAGGIAAASLPLLAEETSATARALRHIVKNFGWKRGLKQIPTAAAALGTYYSVPAATLASNHLAKRRDAKKKDEDKSFVPGLAYHRKITQGRG